MYKVALLWHDTVQTLLTDVVVTLCTTVTSETLVLLLHNIVLVHSHPWVGLSGLYFFHSVNGTLKINVPCKIMLVRE